MPAGRIGILFAALLLATFAAFAVALSVGSADLALADVLRAVRGSAPEQVQSLVGGLRLPRAMTAFAVGGLLAVAGVAAETSAAV